MAMISQHSPMRLVAADAGFLPPGPATVFADIAAVNLRDGYTLSANDPVIAGNYFD